MALLAIVVAVIAVRKRMSEATQRFEEFRKEIEAANYEINLATRQVEGLIDEIEELNNLAFFTDGQKDELNSLGEKLAEIVGEDNVVRINGEIDFDLSTKLISQFLADKQAEYEKNINDLFNESVKSSEVNMYEGEAEAATNAIMASGYISADK